MKRYLIPFLVVCCFMNVNVVVSQCVNAPKVVRIQVDACGLNELGNEFFQFIAGDVYNLNTNATSINVDAISRGGFQAPTQLFLDALNAKTTPCISPVFVNPYSPPYNGIIPPGSVVLAFIDPNPNVDALRTNLRPLCGKAPVFVIRGAGASNSTAMFLNRLGCSFSCPRNINVTFGGCNRLYSFDANLLDGVTGAYLSVMDDGSVVYELSDGCIPVSLDCNKPNFITPNLSPLTCKAVGFELPEISDIFTGNARYFTQPGRSGTSYTIGTILYDSILLYANDFNSCNPPSTQIEKTFLVRISTGPVIAPTMDRTDITCGYFVLPKIEGTNLSGNEKYWTQTAGRGVSYVQGDTIKSAQILYPYDTRFGCPDEARLELQFRGAPNITNIKDTTVPCNTNYIYPPIVGNNLTINRAYYSAPNKGSAPIAAGTTLTTAGRYYSYDEFGNCFDEDTFIVTLTPKVVLPKDTFRNDTFCSTYRLPTFSLPITYNTKLDRSGLPFSPGSIIPDGMKLYINAGLPGCLVQDSIVLTRRFLSINPIASITICDPVLDSLPKVTGNFLTGFEAYYSEPGGRGKRYKAGDTVHAFKRNYLYDSKPLYAYDSTQYRTGKCVSEIPFIIPFITIVESDPLPDTSILCNQSYIIPTIEPSSFFNKAVYSLPDRQGIKYSIGDPISIAGTYYTYSDFAQCHDEDTFRLSIDQGPQFLKGPDLNGCVFATLPKIEGTRFDADSTFYFDQPNGLGVRYRPGATVSNSGPYYVLDLSQPCTQDTILVNIAPLPDLPAERNFTGCDSVRLPAPSGYPLLGYYTILNNRLLLPGTWIPRDTLLVMRNGETSCFVQDFVTIQIIKSPIITPIPDTTVCNEFLLPIIRGQFLTGGEHYHAISLSQGEDWFGNGREFIDQSMTLYVWDGDPGGCWDEDTFNITILPKPTIDSIPEVNTCKSYTLQTPTGSNLTSVAYYDRQKGQGRSFAPGVTFNTSARLFMYQSSSICPAEQVFNINIQDSITSDFLLADSIFCENQRLNLVHTGLKNDSTHFQWSLDQPSSIIFADQARQVIQLDSGRYSVKLKATAAGCVGPEVSKNFSVIPQLTPLTNLNCVEGPDNIVFTWEVTPGVTEYGIELLQGPTGVRSPNAMIFSNLTLGQVISIRVTPLAATACGNGLAAALTCRTKICDPITVRIADEALFCSGDASRPLVAVSVGLSPGDTNITTSWTGPGMVGDVFSPSIAGPGNHIIQYTIVKDSCTYSDTAIIRVGSGSVIILNDKAVECAPPSQQQLDIRMIMNSLNTPYKVHYSYKGNVSSVFESSSPNFTLSVSFGLIGDSIRIDSIVDAGGCKMQITSNAGTRTFRAVRFISSRDTISTCNFVTRTYQYRIRLINPNSNDPYRILTGGGTIQDSVYISPPIPFSDGLLARVTHLNGCDTLVFNLMSPCADCIRIRDTIRNSACENQIVTIRGKSYTMNKPSGIDTIPPAIVGACDTLRFISINFVPNRILLVRSSICPDDIISIGNRVFDKNNTTAIIRLPNASSTGCDSVINVQLEVLAPKTTMIRDTLCSGESVILGGILFDQNHTRDSILYRNQASNGCDSIVYFQVNVQSLRADVTTESAGCTGTSTRSVLIRNVTGGSAPYSYTLNPNTPTRVIQSFPIRINTLPSDTFNVLIKSSVSCTTSVPVAFSPISTGLRLTIGADRTIIVGDTVHILISANFNISSYRWITQSKLSCLNCLNPIASPDKSTLYILEATDNNGCTVRDSLRILVDPNVNIYIPNVFTSKAELENNQRLFIYPSRLIQGIVRFSIYDRWGSTILDLRDLPMDTPAIPVWDGRFKDQDSPVGVYAYKIIFTTADGKFHTKYGDVTLIR